MCGNIECAYNLNVFSNACVDRVIMQWIDQYIDCRYTYTSAIGGCNHGISMGDGYTISFYELYGTSA